MFVNYTERERGDDEYPGEWGALAYKQDRRYKDGENAYHVDGYINLGE